MARTSADKYLKTRVMTASPVELQIMLLEGCIGFCRQARKHRVEGDRSLSHHFFIRAQHVILELSGGLRREVHPELCENLGALYHFLFVQLFQANTSGDLARVDAVISILETLTAGWRQLMQKLASEKETIPVVQPGQPMELSA